MPNGVCAKQQMGTMSQMVSSTSSDGHMQQLIKLLSHPYSAKNHYEDRKHFMNAVGQLFRPADDVWVFLWLLDENLTQCELRLEQILQIDKSGKLKALREASWMQGAVFTEYPTDREADMLELAPRLLSARHSNGRAAAITQCLPLSAEEIEEHFFPLKDPFESADATASPKVIGCIQVLALGAQNQHDPNMVSLVVEAMAGQIVRSREYRIWKRLNELGQTLIKQETAQDMLTEAAKVIRADCMARCCTISFVRNRSGAETHRGQATRDNESPIEFPHLVAMVAEQQKTMRISNLRTAELPAKAAQAPSERPAMAWLAVPVLADVWPQSKEPTGVICVIEVAGKNPEDFFYSAFSHADQEFVERVADMLADHLPRLENRLAMKAITDGLERIEKLEVGESIYGEVERLLMDLAPCATYMAVTSDNDILHHSQSTPVKVLANSQHIIGAVTDGQVVTLGNGPAYVTPLSYIDNERSFRLVVGLTHANLFTYRLDIIDILRREVGSLIADRHRYRRLIDGVVEIRHAWLAGLTGAIGHLDTARRLFHRYSGKSPDHAHRRLIEDPILRQSLDWAFFFAKRTMVFVDETRLLRDRISRSDLKLIYYNLPKLLEEVIVCVTPAAEGRGCKINFHKSITSEESCGWGDRDMLFIMFFNIIDNAVKYSHREKQIFIELNSTIYHWNISITNTGPYIRESDYKTIFDQFQRKNTVIPANSRHPGTGLGLPVAAMILAAHDEMSEIEVKSHPLSDYAAKTCFALTLPRRVRG